LGMKEKKKRKTVSLQSGTASSESEAPERARFRERRPCTSRPAAAPLDPPPALLLR
jgi:hypothetical protein